MDSALLSSASMFTQNIYKTIIRKQVRVWVHHNMKQLSLFLLTCPPPLLQASERELQWVIRISVLLVGLAGTGLAFGGDSVLAFWILSGDLTYVVIFPQLLCVLHFQHVNCYGAISGFVVGLLLRGLSGEPVLGIPTVLRYPGWREENNVVVQYFPYRTVAMLASLLSIITVSCLVDRLFHHQLIPPSWDFLKVFKEKNEPAEEEMPDTSEEMKCALTTKF